MKTTDFIRLLIENADTISYAEICDKVYDNRKNLLDLPADYKHKVRHVLSHLKDKQSEIVAIRRGLYQKRK